LCCIAVLLCAGCGIAITMAYTYAASGIADYGVGSVIVSLVVVAMLVVLYRRERAVMREHGEDSICGGRLFRMWIGCLFIPVACNLLKLFLIWLGFEQAGEWIFAPRFWIFGIALVVAQVYGVYAGHWAPRSALCTITSDEEDEEAAVSTSA
jgi:hypothetical protein